ncbi:MAG TPA: DUF4147 domain-containing protein [Terriglobales bacterium]
MHAAIGTRDLARQIFLRGLAESSIARGFEKHVSCEHGVLRICEDLYDLNACSRAFVISIGKAAHTTLEALVAQAGERFEGIVSSSIAPTSQLRGFRYFLSGHPVPNRDSVLSAEAMLKSLHALDESSLAIFLLSGGGSAMVEKPIDDEIPLEDLVATYRALVLSGAPIGEINALRKHFSAVKGGRLAQAAYPAQQVSLLISDVPEGTPDALASGPTMPDSTTVEECYAIARKHSMAEQFPASTAELLRRRALEETPKSDDPGFVRSRWWTLLSNQTALENAAAEADRAGYPVTIDNSCDDWDYERAAEYLLNRVSELRHKMEKACLISGGEVTVKVKDGGTGGRNQQFALACALKLERPGITILSAGTDGIDGNSPAAGAIADSTTVERARARGLNANAHLAGFNAYPLFEALGDALITGPTGNNLRDLRILLAG